MDLIFEKKKKKNKYRKHKLKLRKVNYRLRIIRIVIRKGVIILVEIVNIEQKRK